MENEEQKNTNYAQVSGEILNNPQKSHEILGEKFYEFNLKVQRLSGKCDVLPITISERIMLGDTLKQGDFVKIAGQFRSYNKIENGKSRLMLSVFAKECEKCQVDAFLNEIRLEGYVCKAPIYRTTPFNREIADVLLAVNRSFGKSDYIPLIVWGRNARFVRDLQVGSKVSVFGRIQSREYQKKLEDDTIQTRTAFEISCQGIAACSEDDNTSIFDYLPKDNLPMAKAMQTAETERAANN